MKTVEEASLENSKNHYIGSFSDELHKDADLDFRAGVEFAQRWISVKDELPGYGEKVLVMIDDLSGKYHENGLIDIDYVVNVAHCVKRFNCEINTQDKVTHWRPIEYK